MNSYRKIWENFFNYLKEQWLVKDFQLIETHHVIAYIDYKIEYYPSKQYLEKISSALGKLEIALTMFANNVHCAGIHYDFSPRQIILDTARDLKKVSSNYHNRAYKDPVTLIQHLKEPKHQAAALMQYEGGVRIEGVALIKPEQLLGETKDPITNRFKWIIYTKEKGGKEGEVLVNLGTFFKVKRYHERGGVFKINRQAYYNDIKQACIACNETLEASHGFRWNYAKRRMFEYAKAGYSYEDSLLGVSNEMKHNRKDITNHYLGGY